MLTGPQIFLLVGTGVINSLVMLYLVLCVARLQDHKKEQRTEIANLKQRVASLESITYADE